MSRFVVFEAGNESNSHYQDTMDGAREIAKTLAYKNPSCPIEVYQRIAVFLGELKVTEKE